MNTSAHHRCLIFFCLLAAGGIAIGAEESERQLLAVLAAPESSEHDRALACEKLATVGGKASVQPLGAMLADPRFSHYARYALQANPHAGAELRKALGRVKRGELIGLISTLAARRDVRSVDEIGKLLRSDDASVAEAAAGALASIGTPECIELLVLAADSRPDTFNDALLRAGQTLVKQGEREDALSMFERVLATAPPPHLKHAATLGMLSACSPERASTLVRGLLVAAEPWKFDAGLQAANRLGAEQGTRVLTLVFTDSSPERKRRILSTLARRGDKAALPTVRAAMGSPLAGVRGEAIVALGQLGEPSDVEKLLAVALDHRSPFQRVARDSLVEIPSPRLNEALSAMLASANEGERLLAADVLGRRRAVSAAVELFAIAKASESLEMRLAALVAIKRIGPAGLMLPLLDHAASEIGPEERGLAEGAALSAALKAPDRDLAARRLADRILTHPAEQRRLLFLALKSVGGPAALEVVSEAAEGDDQDLQDQATRVLGAWQTADVAPVLLRVARSDNPFRIRALRGYLRVARQLNVNLIQKAAMCREALALVERQSERELVLEVLSRTPTADSLGIAESVFASHPSEASATAVLAVAEQVKQAYPKQAREAVRRVIASTPSAELLERAEAMLAESNRAGTEQ